MTQLLTHDITLDVDTLPTQGTKIKRRGLQFSYNRQWFQSDRSGVADSALGSSHKENFWMVVRVLSTAFSLYQTSRSIDLR
jgi:hypothetical protein